MFIFDFVAETVLDQIIDWLYGRIVGFLNDFFAMMNNMGVERIWVPFGVTAVLFLIGKCNYHFFWLAWLGIVCGRAGGRSF